jgi:hypothetical protein
LTEPVDGASDRLRVLVLTTFDHDKYVYEALRVDGGRVFAA